MILELRKKRYAYNNIPKRRKNSLKTTHEFYNINKNNKKRNRDTYEEDREDIKKEENF